MTDKSRPTDLLHAHHLSRQIGNVHERVKKVEAFHEDSTALLKRLDSFTKSNDISDAREVIEETKDYLTEASSQRQVLQNHLTDLTKTVLNVQDQNRKVLDDIHKLFSKEFLGQNSMASDSSLLNRVVAIENVQKTTDRKIDKIHQILERFERGNESLRALATEIMHYVQSHRSQIPQTPHYSLQQALLPTSPTESVIRSSPPLEHIMPSENTKIFLQSGKKMLAVKQHRRRPSIRHSRLFRYGQSSSNMTPSAMLRRKKDRNALKRDNLTSAPVGKSGISASGFNIVGEPHQVTYNN
jgi:hypothetical protein